MIDVACPQCGVVYHSEQAHVGKQLRCARCGSLVPILGAARNIVRQSQTPSPSVERVHQTQTGPSVRRFKSPYLVPTAIGILVALGAVGLIVYVTRTDAPRTGTASVSDIEPTLAQQQQTQSSQQGNSPDFQIISEEPIPKSDKPAHVADRRPTEYNSLPTGTRIEEDLGTGGHGELKVENGTSEDAVARLSDVANDQTSRWFFVQAHSTAQVAHISEGMYKLTFTTGLNWVESEDAFSWHPSYSEFDRTFEFREQRDSEGVQYHSISVTLHPVRFGNVRTKTITREEFLKGHRHVALQR